MPISPRRRGSARRRAYLSAATPVAGRAGRADRPGTMLQAIPAGTSCHAGVGRRRPGPVCRGRGDARKQHNMPPFGRLAAVIVSGRDERNVDETAAALGRSAPQSTGCPCWAGPAPIAVVRGRHRLCLLMRARKDVNVQDLLRRWVFAMKPAGGWDHDRCRSL